MNFVLFWRAQSHESQRGLRPSRSETSPSGLKILLLQA